MILMHLAQIAITDGKLDEPEVEFFKYVGTKLGFEGSYSDQILEWGKENLRVNKHKKSLLKKAKQHTLKSRYEFSGFLAEWDALSKKRLSIYGSRPTRKQEKDRFEDHAV